MYYLVHAPPVTHPPNVPIYLLINNCPVIYQDPPILCCLGITVTLPNTVYCTKSFQHYLCTVGYQVLRRCHCPCQHNPALCSVLDAVKTLCVTRHKLNVISLLFYFL